LRASAGLPEKESFLRDSETISHAGASFYQGYLLESLRTAIVITSL
jgi:hypothetical protein